ncbi:hypothetical protein [Halorussus ruber]|uniref:hypothetical protein n=1 Tax=Halorussus ruber TaxID=1126238 RepID=UPI001B2FE7C2|nr:hypothetical protein [Halorussus ruber]
MSDSTPDSNDSPAQTETTAEAEIADDQAPDVPDWDDEYVDRVSDRLMHNFDLEKDRTVRGEAFTLYGQLVVHSEKHFFHPALSFGHHDQQEHLFVRRTGGASVADAERLVELGHDLADEWIEADEEHYSTDFTFVLVVPTISADLREFVADFRDRTMLKYGYYGHYEINLVAVAPDEDDIVASQEATVEEAFRLWDPIEKERPGLLRLIARRFQI